MNESHEFIFAVVFDTVTRCTVVPILGHNVDDVRRQFEYHIARMMAAQPSMDPKEFELHRLGTVGTVTDLNDVNAPSMYERKEKFLERGDIPYERIIRRSQAEMDARARNSANIKEVNRLQEDELLPVEDTAGGGK